MINADILPRMLSGAGSCIEIPSKVILRYMNLSTRSAGMKYAFLSRTAKV
jgi:hypothetical protein